MKALVGVCSPSLLPLGVRLFLDGACPQKVCVCRSRLDQCLCQACPPFIPFDENECAVENSFSF